MGPFYQVTIFASDSLRSNLRSSACRSLSTPTTSTASTSNISSNSIIPSCARSRRPTPATSCRRSGCGTRQSRSGRRDFGELLGVGALKELAHDHGEVKSMRTAPAALGKGVGRAMLRHIVAEAEARGYKRLSLETGIPSRSIPPFAFTKASVSCRGARLPTIGIYRLAAL